MIRVNYSATIQDFMHKTEQKLDDLDKHSENEVIQNPYYEMSDEKLDQDAEKRNIIPDWDETEKITTTKNIYHHM